jgi:hypothetical protein
MKALHRRCAGLDVHQQETAYARSESVSRRSLGCA